jgi:hypothetical protein
MTDALRIRPCGHSRWASTGLIALACSVQLVSASSAVFGQAAPSPAPPAVASPGAPAAPAPGFGEPGGNWTLSKAAPPGSEPPATDPRDITGIWATINVDRYAEFVVKPEFVGKTPPPGKYGFAVPSLESRRCIPSQKLQGSPYPMEILQTPGLITIIQEENRRTRWIYLDRPQTQHPTPSHFGHSVGHWEGDTLVVDTIGLKGDQDFALQGSPDIHIVERMRKIDAGKVLEDQVTYYNDKYWSRPGTYRVRYNWRPDLHLMEYSCEEFSNAYGKGYDSLR